MGTLTSPKLIAPLQFERGIAYRCTPSVYSTLLDARSLAAPASGEGRVVELVAELVHRREHDGTAGVEQLLLGEPAGEHPDGVQAGALRGLGVPRRVADHDGVAAARLLH